MKLEQVNHNTRDPPEGDGFGSESDQKDTDEKTKEEQS
jgi:hypothetical protein